MPARIGEINHDNTTNTINSLFSEQSLGVTEDSELTTSPPTLLPVGRYCFWSHHGGLSICLWV